MALLPQLLRRFDIRVVLGNFNVDGLGEGSWELDIPEFCCPKLPEDKPPELESPDFKADARFGGDDNPTEKIFHSRYWIIRDYFTMGK